MLKSSKTCQGPAIIQGVFCNQWLRNASIRYKSNNLSQNWKIEFKKRLSSVKGHLIVWQETTITINLLSMLIISKTTRTWNRSWKIFPRKSISSLIFKSSCELATDYDLQIQFWRGKDSANNRWSQQDDSYFT